MSADETEHDEIDQRLQKWRQGDCVVGQNWVLFRLDTDFPLTPESLAAAAEGVDAGELEVPGFVVVSQTCEIVRSCRTKPYVEVCPLFKVEPNWFEEIRKGRRPRYAHVPGLSDDLHLVADLDMPMTVEKTVVAKWARIEGCGDDYQRRRMSLALSRKRGRFAFPDEFVAFAEELQGRLSEKHNKKNSDEGRALRALDEIRVRAAPSWEAPNIELTFYFIRSGEIPVFEGKGWNQFLDLWLKLVEPDGRYCSVEGLVVTLDDMTARDYTESDPLDLERLSST